MAFLLYFDAWRVYSKIMRKYFFIIAILFLFFTLPTTTFADVGQLKIQYTFIGDYALPAHYTIVQKLSGNAQQTQGGTSQGNPGYIHDISI